MQSLLVRTLLEEGCLLINLTIHLPLPEVDPSAHEGLGSLADDELLELVLCETRK